MKIIGLFLLFALLFNEIIISQGLPEGYILQYQQDFTNKISPEEFRFSAPDLFDVKTGKVTGFLQMSPVPQKDSVLNRQDNLFIVDNIIFGDFILEVNAMSTEPVTETGLSFYFGVKDTLNYYCLRILTHTGENDTLLFAKLKGRHKKIDTKTNSAIAWVPGKWHKLRIERDIVATSLKLYFDNMKTPCIVMVDRTFIMGYIGFGPGATTTRISNIKIWSQTSIPQPAKFFSR
ncbi:MAG: hypothetical protein R6W78_00625 [Bacteroidales bacterium]